MKVPGKRTVLVIVVVLVFGVAYVVFRPKTPNPVYQGRRLSEWLVTTQTPVLRTGNFMLYDPVRDDAALAIRAVGTNALPLLLEWLNAEPNSLLTNFATALAPNGWLPNNSWRQRLLDKLEPWDYLRRRSCAYTGFRILGSNAFPAVPALQLIASRSKPRDNEAVFILTGMGSVAVPALTKALAANPYSESRIHILNGLGFIASSNAVPGVISALHDPDPDVVAAAARNVGRIHQRADVAVPALLDIIEHSPVETQRQAIMALGEFGSDAKQAEFTLYRLLNHFVLGECAEAALKKIQLPRFDTGETPIPRTGFDLDDSEGSALRF